MESANIELFRHLTFQDKYNTLDIQYHSRQNKQKIIRKEWDELEKWKFSLLPKSEYPLPI